MTQSSQPVPDGSDVTMGELARGLNSIRDQIALLRTDAVLRVEFEPRMTAMDREIRELKDANKTRDQAETTRRPRWTEIATALCAVATICMAIVFGLQAVK